MRMLKDGSGVGDNFRIFRLVPRLQTQLVVEGLRLSLWAPSTKRPRRGEENLARCSREVRSPLDRQEENRKADQRRDSAAHHTAGALRSVQAGSELAADKPAEALEKAAEIGPERLKARQFFEGFLAIVEDFL